MIRTTTRISRYLAVGLLMISLAISVLGSRPVEAAPIIAPVVDNVSPSASQIDSGNPPHHNLVLSDHGKVQSVEVGMYFKNPTGNYFRINVDNICNMDNVPPNSADPDGHRANRDTYLVVEIFDQRDNQSQKIRFTGNEACNGTLNNHVFNINDRFLANSYKRTGLYGTKALLRWVNDADINCPDCQIRSRIATHSDDVGSRIRFRFRVPAGPIDPVTGTSNKVGLIDTSQAGSNITNNSIVHNNQVGSGYRNIYQPFGLKCGVEDEPRGFISVYDADNGSHPQELPLRFYVGKVSGSDIVPLSVGDYRGNGGGRATGPNDIWFNEEPDGTRDNISPRKVEMMGGHPVFTPSNFDNVGGLTQVRIHAVEPQPTKYVLVVERIHSGQFIYMGLPGDAIYGSRDFTCPTTSSISPNVGLTADSFEPGGRVTATASVTNTASTNVTSDYRRVFWYENSTTIDDKYRNGDSADDLAGSFGENNRTVSKTYNARGNTNGPIWQDTIPPDAKRVCTQLTLTNPPPGISVEDNPTPPVCENIIRKPYFKVTHGDVNAAASLSSPTCNASTGRVSAFNRGAGHAYGGSGSDIGVFSARQVTEFASGRAPKGLTFANTGSTAGSSTYGGGFRHTYCIPSSYWDNPTASGDRTTTCSGNNISTTGSIFITATNCTLVDTVGVGNVPNLRRVTATGNIYISKNLQNLDGIFVAQGDIYTCSESLNTPVAIQDMATQCNRQLKIRGALITGGTVKLQRTLGSLKGNTPAEIIEYNPFVWLSAINPVNPLSRSADNKFDYITALPPVL